MKLASSSAQKLKLLAALIQVSLVILSAHAALDAGDGRDIVPLVSDWRFHQGPLSSPLPAPGADAEWAPVTVPHSWSNAEAVPGKGFYTGDSWYSRHIKFDRKWTGKRVFLRFDAVSLLAEPYLNGKRLGEHHGGFAAFTFEITKELTTGDNLLQVRVNNARRDDISPLGGDFTIFGGVYRPVSLIVTDPVDISPMDAGSPGVFLKQVMVTRELAKVEATTEVNNGTTTARSVNVSYRVVDAKGHEVMTRSTTGSIAPGETGRIMQTLNLSQPHLWDGVADPYLYHVEVTLRSGNILLDKVVQPLGLRSMRIDPAHGFILNDAAPRQIHGVCLHQEIDSHGWAVTPAEEANDMRLIREMGANGVRLVHYQHSQSFLDAADREGMLVWAELTQVDHVSGSDAYHENIRQQLVELIRQNYNHPSIFTWSLFNELNSPTKAISTPLIEELNVLAHREDPTRPTTGAASGDTIANLHQMVAALDLISVNLYPGWYGEAPDAMEAGILKWNKAYGARGLSVSEYGGGASVSQHKQGLVAGDVKPNGHFHPEEWQALVHEGTYKAISSHPEVWGSFLWVMFDFASIGRHEGDIDGQNDKGLVTRDRQVRKDAYFFYQAQWSATPMVYLTSRRDKARTSASTDVKVYSNQPKVTASINGHDLGPATEVQPHVFLWKHATLNVGENRISTQAGSVSDESIWTLQPSVTTTNSTK